MFEKAVSYDVLNKLMNCFVQQNYLKVLYPSWDGSIAFQVCKTLSFDLFLERFRTFALHLFTYIYMHVYRMDLRERWEERGRGRYYRMDFRWLLKSEAPLFNKPPFLHGGSLVGSLVPGLVFSAILWCSVFPPYDIYQWWKYSGTGNWKLDWDL